MCFKKDILARWIVLACALKKYLGKDQTEYLCMQAILNQILCQGSCIQPPISCLAFLGSPGKTAHQLIPGWNVAKNQIAGCLPTKLTDQAVAGLPAGSSKRQAAEEEYQGLRRFVSFSTL